MPLSYSPIFSLIGVLLICLVIVNVVTTNTTKIGEGIFIKWWQQKVCQLFFYEDKSSYNRSLLACTGAFIVLSIVLDQMHASFPVLHHFYNSKRKESIVLAIAIVDEALTIIEFGIQQPLPKHFIVARRAISGYLTSVRDIGLKPAKYPPPIPCLGLLQEAGLPVVSDRQWSTKLETIQQRRGHLLALIEQSSWSWKDIG